MAETPSPAPEPHRSPSEPGESRAETRERVLSDMADSPEAPDRLEMADSSAQRGLLGQLGRSVGRWALIGAGLGVLIGVLLLVISPGPLDIGGGGEAIGALVGIALVFALIVAVFAALFIVEREDGRVEREVEDDTGRNPGAPAQPLDPKHDVEGG